MITEEINIFGEQANLQGIASIPKINKSKTCAVILLNAGVVHKVGPFNLNVDIARILSSNGYFVFRFDLAGLGDSTKIKTGISNIQQSLEDLDNAISHLNKHYYIEKFIVIGLCTGADHAHKISVHNKSVVGNVWLDGYGFPTPGFYLKKLTPILFNPPRLIKSVISRLNLSVNKKQLSDVDAYVWKLPKIKDYILDMKQLDKRGCKSLYIFSGGVRSYYNYKNQFRDRFQKYKFWRNIDVEYYPEFDHTYVIINDRMVIIQRIEDWLNINFSD